MAQFLYHRNTGRVYEVVALDRTTNTITLKNDMAQFSDTYDKEKLKQQGYMPILGEDAEEACENARVKIAAEQEAA